MKKQIIGLLAVALLAGAGCSKKLADTGSYFHSGSEYLNSEGDGSITVRAYGMGKTREDAIEQVDHAGLECSVILGKYPNLDVVSLGPTLRSPHTTIERCLIPTVAPFWELLKKTMAEVPEK